jgi:ABC-type Fe3+/spermidine/putrescine transport system ATPase subunit
MEEGEPAILAIRSENISVWPSSGASAGEAGIVSGVVAHKTYRGHATRLEVTGAFAESLFPSVVGRCDLAEGDEVEVGLPADSICVYADGDQAAS